MKRQRDTDKDCVFQKKGNCSLLYQCGPISIYNALRKQRKYMSLVSLIKMCQAHPIHGTSIENMSKTIEVVNKKK